MSSLSVLQMNSLTTLLPFFPDKLFAADLFYSFEIRFFATCSFLFCEFEVTNKLHGSQSPIRLLRVSHCVKKSLIFFNMVQAIDLIFCEIIEIIEQNFFNSADFLFRF